MARKKLQDPAPAPVVAYNLSTNSLDRLDQYRSKNIIMYQEKRLLMSIFTYFLN